MHTDIIVHTQVGSLSSVCRNASHDTPACTSYFRRPDFLADRTNGRVYATV